MFTGRRSAYGRFVMKRIISFLLALTMSFSIVMPSVAAAYEGSDHASASVSDVSSPEGSETVQPEADAAANEPSEPAPQP